MDWAAERMQTVDREPSEVLVRQGKYHVGGAPAIRHCRRRATGSSARPSFRPYCLRPPATYPAVGSPGPSALSGMAIADARIYLARIDHVTPGSACLLRLPLGSVGGPDACAGRQKGVRRRTRPTVVSRALGRPFSVGSHGRFLFLPNRTLAETENVVIFVFVHNSFS